MAIIESDVYIGKTIQDTVVHLDCCASNGTLALCGEKLVTKPNRDKADCIVCLELWKKNYCPLDGR